MTDPTSPAVSVIVNSYNRTRYLKQAIESIQHQTCSDWELLIVDDGSADPGPRQIARQYAEQDRRIRTLFLPGNVGPAGARNAGIATVKGQYICFQDDDDISHPRRLETQLGLLRKKPEFAAVVGAIALCDARMKVQDIWGPDSLYSARPATDWPVFNAGGNAAMIRRDALLQAGGYRPWFQVAEDWDLCLRLQDNHPIAAIPDTALLYRRHHDRRLTRDPMLWSYHCAALISAGCRRTGRKDPIADNPKPEALLPLFKDLPESVRQQRFPFGINDLRKAIQAGQPDRIQELYSRMCCCYEEAQVAAGAVPLAWEGGRDRTGDFAFAEKALTSLPQTAAVQQIRQWWQSLLKDLYLALVAGEQNHTASMLEKLDLLLRQQSLPTPPVPLLAALIQTLVAHGLRIPKQVSRTLRHQIKQQPHCTEPLLQSDLFHSRNLKMLMRQGHYSDIRFLLSLYASGATQETYLAKLRQLRGKALKYSLLYFKPGYWLAR